MATYKALLTTAGAAKIAAATAGGTQVKITRMAVGDGGGKLPTPDPKQTKLVNEVYRANLNRLSIDAKNSNYLVAELVIQPDVGGFWMREMGLYDADGVLIAVSNMAESYKPQLAEGSGRLQTLRMVLIVSEIESIALSIDGSTVMATKDYVDDKLAAHEKSRNHPDGTLTAKGFVQLNSSVSSTSETLAATPKAVKAANDNANTRVPATRKVNNKALSADITLSSVDVGAIAPGEFGLGGKAPLLPSTITLLADPSIIGFESTWTVTSGYTDAPAGNTSPTGVLHNIRRTYDAGCSLIQYLYMTGGAIYVRTGGISSGVITWHGTSLSGDANGWRKVYDSAQKPTASDVGALPVVSGVLGTANINTFNLTKIGLYVQSTGANATVANGYPAGSQAAGVLEVMPASWTGGVLQRYTVQNTGMVWTRALNASWNGTDGPWRDWVQVSGVGSVAANTALGSTDLNTVGFGLTGVQAAIYHQSANASATVERNYPEAKAGTLFVTGSAYGCQQMYITFDTCNVWMRGLSTNWNGKDGPWRPWVAVYGTNNKPTASDVGAWTASQSAASEKALADEIATAFKIRANLTATDSPNTIRGSAMFGHYGVPGAAAATTQKGYPMNGFVGVILVTWGPNATQQIAFNNNGRQFTRAATGAWNGADGPWSAWVEVYSPNNKPTAADVGALPAAGTAAAATKLATARKIAGVAFDGTKDIALNADNVGAFPRNGGDVNGGVTANFLRAITLPQPGNGQGTYLGWNESGGQGESNFVNNKGGGVGGFVFRIVNQANSAQTGYVRISGTGDISAQGNFYTDGGGIYEMGQRVYSPNNPPPGIDLSGYVIAVRLGGERVQASTNASGGVVSLGGGEIVTGAAGVGGSDFNKAQWRVRQLQYLLANGQWVAAGSV